VPETLTKETATATRPVVPCCTHCQGTTYSFRRETIANVEGLLVYCQTCGGIFSWSPNIRGMAATDVG
jgi:hypothetical protein